MTPDTIYVHVKQDIPNLEAVMEALQRVGKAQTVSFVERDTVHLSSLVIRGNVSANFIGHWANAKRPENAATVESCMYVSPEATVFEIMRALEDWVCR